MNDVSTVPMYIPILVSLAILMVPGVMIESYWWWNARRRNEREARMHSAEQSPVPGLPSDNEELKAS